MDIDDLRSVNALSRHAHFGRAAAELGVSQPALTKRIRALEARLGGRLFDRDRRQTRLTPAGRVLAERASALVADLARAEAATRGVLAGQTGLLRIGAGMSVMLAGLPRVVRKFRQRHPDVQVSVRDMSSRDQVRALEAGELDAGFVRMTAGDPRVRLERVMKERLRLASVAGRDPGAPLTEPLVTISRTVSESYRAHVERTCAQIGYKPAVVEEVNQLLMVLLLVEAGAGLALVPESAGRLAPEGVALMERELPGAEWEIGLAVHAGFERNPLIEEFRQLVRKVFGA